MESATNTKEFGKHKKSNCEVHKYTEIYVFSPLDDPNSKTHSPAFTTLGGVSTEGEERDLVNRMVISGGNRAGENVRE